MKNIVALSFFISIIFLSNCSSSNLDNTNKEIENTNINHAIATIESKYNSSLNTIASETIDSVNLALNSLEVIDVIGVEESTAPLIISRRFPSLNFQRETPYIHPVDSDIYAYKVFKVGIVDIFKNQAPNNHHPSENHTFLDITDRVVSKDDNTGLLGFAIDLGYHYNGLFYLHYTSINSEASIVTRVSQFNNHPSNPLTANPQSEVILMEIPFPQSQ